MTKSERQADAYAKKQTANNPQDYKMVYEAFLAGYRQHINNWLNKE